jgi:MFS family permease
MQRIENNRFYILGLFFVANILAFWPGYMKSDSMGQYIQAVAGQYSDHHPPMMSFIWHYLNLIHAGSGLIYLLQLVLLYGSVVILLKASDLLDIPKRSLMNLVLLCLPIYPPVLFYSVEILKDIQYSYSFLFVSSVLAYYTILGRRPIMPVIYGVLLLMIYGAAVKYQGQFCVIVLAVWLGCLLNLGSGLWRKIISGGMLYATVLLCISGVNNYLVPQTSKNNSWQLVKLYDLAAISIAIQQDLIPESNKTNYYTFQKLQDKFIYPSVDPCVFPADAILTASKSEAQMSVLYRAWLKNIIMHPMAYIKHRSINMSYILISRPGYQYFDQWLKNIPAQSPWHNIAKYSIGALFYIFMSHLLVVILGVGYLILALLSWRDSRAAPVLLGFSSLALLMVAILFGMSMAGVPRYTYISIVLIHSMHAFAYSCYCARRQAAATVEFYSQLAC